MIGFAADDDAERDITVIAAGLGRAGYRGRNLKRARHGHHLDFMPLERRARAFEEEVVQVIVEACLDDEQHGHTQASASRSEGHTSELQSLMRISYVVFCLKKKK